VEVRRGTVLLEYEMFMHSIKVRDLADSRQRIIEAVELITRHMLINTAKA
jgi:hypothetical protein